jgi:hypothetical protein
MRVFNSPAVMPFAAILTAMVVSIAGSCLMTTGQVA